MAWLTVDRKCPCKGCDRRLVGCHSLCAEYKDWRLELDKQNAKKPPSHELSRSMKRHIWRKMLGR